MEGPMTAAALKKLLNLGDMGPGTEFRQGTDGPWIPVSPEAIQQMGE
jgi:hypothetical protein